MPFYLKNSKLVTSKVIRNTNSINKNILINHINISTTNKLFGKNPSTDLYVYSYQNPYANFVRNPSCWLNGVTNISCFSPAQLSGANWFQRGGTLITRKHALFAKHFIAGVISGGTPLIFIDDNNNKYQPKIIDYGYDTTDIAIALLDNEVNANIKIAKVLPPNYNDYLTVSSSYPIYAFGLDQEEKAIIKLWNSYSVQLSSIDPNSSSYKTYPQPTQFSSFSETMITGDSGNPIFIIIDNELVVLSTWYTAVGGPFISDRYSQVNSIIESLSPGEGYSLTPVDLAAVYSKYS